MQASPLKTGFQARRESGAPHRPLMAVNLNGLLDPSLTSPAKRLAWAMEAAGRHMDGVEIPVSRGFLHQDWDRDGAGMLPVLTGLRRVFLHLIPIGDYEIFDPAAERAYLAALRGMIGDMAAADALPAGVVVHPGDLVDLAAFEGLAESGCTPCLEVMGAEAVQGNTVEYFQEALVKYPGLGLTLDAAHVHETQAAGGAGFNDYARALGDKVEWMHVSLPGNLYDRRLGSVDFDTSHSLTCLNGPPAWLPPVWQSLGRPPLSLEGVVPAGDTGRDMLKEEMHTVKRAFIEHAGQTGLREASSG